MNTKMNKIQIKIFLSLCFISLFPFARSDDQDFISCMAENKISNIVFSPNYPSFTDLLTAHIKNNRYNRPSTPKPTLIVAPTDEAHVSTIVLCANQSSTHLKIRSGGHDYEGISYISSDEFVILDMFNLNSISADLTANTARVGAGALLGEIYHAISSASKTLAFPAGVCPTVGVGGSVSGGGYGNLIRKFGLSVDNMLDATIVVANGSALTVSGNDDLFWALRGGGAASFGVVLSYTLKLVTIEPIVTVFRVERFQSENASGIIFDYQNIAPSLDNDLFIRAILEPITENDNTRAVRATFVAIFIGDSKRLVNEILTPEFPSLGLKESDCEEMSWIESVLFWANLDTTKPEVLLNRHSDTVRFLKRKSDYLKSAIGFPDMEKIFEAINENENAGIAFNPYGGRMDEISESDAPFPHRKGNLFKIQYFANWNETSEGAEDEYMKQIRSLYDFMTPYVSSNPREAFLNYRDLDIGTNNGTNNYTLGEVYGRSYFKDNFDRLVDTKTKVDPDNFFRNEQSIPTRHA